MTVINSVQKALYEFFEELLKRKLVTGVLFFLIALVIVENGIYVVSTLVFLLLILILCVHIKKYKNNYVREAIIFSTLFFVVGTLLMLFFQSAGKDVKNGDILRASGRITNVESFEYSNRYTVRIGSAYLKCFLYTDSDIELNIGDKILFSGTVELFDSARNDGEFDSREYYETLNIRFSVNADTVKVSEQKSFSLQNKLRSFRNLLSETIDGHMSKNSGVLKAIMLGDKSDLEEREKYLYQKGGISHILAISGLHVSNFSMLVFFILERLKIPKPIIRIIVIPIILLFAVFSGFSSSAFRATIMFIVSDLAMLKGKNYDISTALALSFFIYSIFYPCAYKSPGTVLSYFAVFSIWFFSISYKKIHLLRYDEPIRKLLERFITKTLSMSIFLSMFSLPMVLNYFYTLPVLSVLVNLYVVPLMTLLFITAICGLIFSLINEFIADCLFKLCSLIISSFTCLTELSIEKCKAVLVIGKPEAWEIILFYLTMFIVLLMLNRVKRRYLLMIILLLPTVLLLTKPMNNSLTMIDVDQGDCSVVTGSDGRVYMIDCGSLGKNQVFKYTVEPYLLSNGIKKIDYVFLSHSDMDHVNGIIQYLNDSTSIIEIRNIIITPQMSNDESINSDIISVAQLRKINVMMMSVGQSIRVGNTQINCIHPEATKELNDSNDSSMVLEFNLGSIKVLFTGDISSSIEREIPVSDMDILKVSHHGSATATSDVILDMISPKLALISCGRENSYGHPATEVLDRLDSRNVRRFISAENGQTRIIVKKSEIKIESYFP